MKSTCASALWKMTCRWLPAIAAMLSAASAAGQYLTIAPTTTRGALLADNTSAADTFQPQLNGNAGAGPVSKAPTKLLLYPGATTKIYAQMVPWFGLGGHINIGYNSSDPAEIHAQVADMYSRGYAGAIMDWYGSGSVLNTTALNFKQEVETNWLGKFTFAIMEDGGALTNYAHSAGCDVTAQMITDLNYIFSMFEGSQAYLRMNGRPVVFFFGQEAYYVDWAKVRASVPGNPLFIFRNRNAYIEGIADGGYAWVEPKATGEYDYNLPYLDDFYTTAQSQPNKTVVGAGYKGFNDTYAAWSGNRVMFQDCGNAWLTSWAEMGKFYSTSNQLPNAQTVTYNDYEEGTETETGIENCVSVYGSVSGSSLSWSVTGNEKGVYFYRVWISTDGSNLMKLKDVPVTVHSLDMSQFALAPATYVLYVQASGKPSFRNKLSDAVAYRPSDQAPVLSLSVSPTSGYTSTVFHATTAGSYDPDGMIASRRIDFGDGNAVNTTESWHTYSAPGTYIVSATVTDNYGVSTTKRTPVVIQAATLGVSITTPANYATTPAQFRFTAKAQGPNAITSMWIYVDGKDVYYIKNTANIDTFLKLDTGTRRVTAIAQDTTGIQVKSTISLNVAPGDIPPTAAVTLTPGFNGVSLRVMACTASSSDGDGWVAGSTVNFGDGTIVGGPTAIHTYAAAGTYTVTATVKDNLGASSSTSSTISVH